MNRIRDELNHICETFISAKLVIYGNVSLADSKIDHDWTRTRNLLIRSQTLYPLGHAANFMAILSNEVKYLLIFTLLFVLEVIKRVHAQRCFIVLTRFNKIYIQNYKFHVASVQGMCTIKSC